MSDTFIFEVIIGTENPLIRRVSSDASKSYTPTQLIDLAESYAITNGIDPADVGVRQYKNGMLIRPTYLSANMAAYELATKPLARRQDASLKQ